MPSSIVRNSAGPEDDDFKARQKLEFDRWRTAIAIVEHMREAGISCELSNDLQNARLCAWWCCAWDFKVHHSVAVGPQNTPSKCVYTLAFSARLSLGLLTPVGAAGRAWLGPQLNQTDKQCAAREKL